MESSAKSPVRLMIGSSVGADAAEIDTLATRLAAELSKNEAVRHLSRVSPCSSERSKSATDVVGWGQIALSLAASGGVLVTLISSVKEWLTRQPPATVVKLKIGDDVLEVSSTSSDAAKSLTQDFLARHS
jgi:Effector Associated Constant Component 1